LGAGVEKVERPDIHGSTRQIDTGRRSAFDSHEGSKKVVSRQLSVVSRNEISGHDLDSSQLTDKDFDLMTEN
jgi:hypothetical protein